METKEKILLLDIETAPAVAYTWGLYDQQVGINQVIEDGYVLMWAAKWLGSKDVMWDALINYPDFKDNPRSDKEIAKSIWKLLDEADIVVTHNGDSFDLRWLNAIFIKNGLPPASPAKSVDTKKEAKKNFRFLSNKLDFITQKLGLGSKLNAGGFDLWKKCMAGDAKAWKKMITYCKQDVNLLEKLYLKLRPYMKTHPNLGLFSDWADRVCPNCGSSDIKKKGWFYTSSGKYQRYCCNKCGKNIRDTQRVARASLVGV